MELRSARASKVELTQLSERAPQLLLCVDFDGTLSPIVWGDDATARGQSRRVPS
jgi:trehalose-6-phosphatase